MKKIKVMPKQKKRMSRKLKKFLRENNLNDIMTALLKSENRNNYFDFSISNKNFISYLKPDRIPEKKHLIYFPEYRKEYAHHAKISKLINVDSVNNSELQKFNALMFSKSGDFNILKTRDFQHYYLQDNYSENKGSLGNSCMRYESLQDAIGFYNTIENVSLLVILDDEKKVIARALFWEDVAVEDFGKIKYLDRIYSINSNYNQILINYARNNGCEFGYDFEDSTPTMKIEIVIDDSQPLPYMDTFSEYSRNGILSNRCGDISLKETEGQALDELIDDGMTCCHCGDEVSEYDALYSEDGGCFCDDCACVPHGSDYAVLMRDCVEIDGNWYLKDDENIVYLEYRNECCLLDDASYSEYFDAYYLNDDVLYCENDDDYILECDGIEIEGKWYIADKMENGVDYIKIKDDENNEGNYLIENCVKINDKWYLKDDDEIVEIEGEYFKKNSDKVIEIDGNFEIAQFELV